MTLRTVLVGFVAVILSILAVTYFARDKPLMVTVAPKVEADADEPEISKTGPHPVAVVDQT
jgi:hypothetical protein